MRGGPARWPLVMAVILSVIAIATLLWLRQRIVSEEEQFLNYARRLYELSGSLQRPENDTVRFTEIESVARSLEERELVRQLVVTKVSRRTGDEHTVYPYFLGAKTDDWKNQVSWRVLDVHGGTTVSGRLYIDVDSSNRTAIDTAAGTFSLLLIVCLGILVTRQRGKDAELGRVRSELEERNVEVIRLERLALAGQLSANILHDLKKPVLNIRHEAEDAAAHPDEIPQDELLRLIDEQTELFLAMLRDLGIEQFVRAEDEEEEYCDVAEIVNRSFGLVRYESRNVELKNTVPADGTIPLIMARPHRLILVFSNLIINACQAMDGEGEIRVSAIAHGDRVVITVRDSGPGVPWEMRERLFEPFSTTRADRGGTGLGLYICASVVGELGGSINIQRETELKGAAFRIELPAAPG